MNIMGKTAIAVANVKFWYVQCSNTDEEFFPIINVKWNVLDYNLDCQTLVNEYK